MLSIILCLLKKGYCYSSHHHRNKKIYTYKFEKSSVYILNNVHLLQTLECDLDNFFDIKINPILFRIGSTMTMFDMVQILNTGLVHNEMKQHHEQRIGSLQIRAHNDAPISHIWKSLLHFDTNKDELFRYLVICSKWMDIGIVVTISSLNNGVIASIDVHDDCVIMMIVLEMSIGFGTKNHFCYIPDHNYYC